MTTWEDVVDAPTPRVLVGITSMREGQRRLCPATWQRVRGTTLYALALAWACWLEQPGASGAERAEGIARRAVVASSLVRAGRLSFVAGREAALRPATRPSPTPERHDEDLLPGADWFAKRQVTDIERCVPVPAPGTDYLANAAVDWYLAAPARWPCPLADLPAHLAAAESLWPQVVRRGENEAQTKAARHLLLGTRQVPALAVLRARNQQPDARLVSSWARAARLLDPRADPKDRTAEQRARRTAARRLAAEPLADLDLLVVARAALGISAA